MKMSELGRRPSVRDITSERKMVVGYALVMEIGILVWELATHKKFC